MTDVAIQLVVTDVAIQLVVTDVANQVEPPTPAVCSVAPFPLLYFSPSSVLTSAPCIPGSIPNAIVTMLLDLNLMDAMKAVDLICICLFPTYNFARGLK